jgi:hypothetical protein
MTVITLNDSIFLDATYPPNSGYINSSVVAGTNNTVSVSIVNNTAILPSTPSLPSIGMGYSSQLFYNSLDTTNILPITGSFSPGSNIQTVTASQLNSMSGTPNASNFYFNKTLVFLYYSNQTYGDNNLTIHPLPNAFIIPAPPGGSLNSYGGVQIANATFTVQPCNQPTSLTATNYATGEVQLTWTAPNNGGSPITDYLIQYRISFGPGPWLTYPHSPSASSVINITGLIDGGTYDFRVAGINGYCGGVGPTSGPFSNIATVTLYTIPTQPTNLVAIASNGGAISLSWNASISSDPNPITYTIQYKVGGFGDWMILTVTTNTYYNIADFNTIAIVNNGVTYCFQVYAQNSINETSYTSNIAQAMPFNNSLVPSREWSRFQPNCPSYKTSMNGIAETSYDMQRKANILQCPVNGILNFTKAMRWSMAAKNQLTRQKGWASQSQTNTYPNITNIDGTPGVGLKVVNNTLTCWNEVSPIICNSSSSSGVPGKPVILCFAADAPFNNYRHPKTYSAGGTKWPMVYSK